MEISPPEMIALLSEGLKDSSVKCLENECRGAFEMAREINRLRHELADVTKSRDERLAEAQKQGAEEERERCCSAICERCEDSVPVVWAEAGNWWVHQIGSLSVECYASAIRALPDEPTSIALSTTTPSPCGCLACHSQDPGLRCAFAEPTRTEDTL